MIDDENLGRCTTRGCPVRFRDGHASACRMHLDSIFDPRHAAQIDNARALLGDRMHLTIPEAALLADREVAAAAA